MYLNPCLHDLNIEMLPSNGFGRVVLFRYIIMSCKDGVSLVYMDTYCIINHFNILSGFRTNLFSFPRPRSPKTSKLMLNF